MYYTEEAPYFTSLDFTDRPNPEEFTEKEKNGNVKFDRDTARYFLSTANTQKWIRSYAGYMVARRMRDSRQWTQMDLETFLKDESGRARNRMAAMQNIVLPIYKQLMGAVLSMAINAKAQATTYRKQTREERSLGKMKLLTQMANSGPYSNEVVREKYPMLGQDEQETVGTHDNYYRDCFEEAVNSLLQVIASDPDNNFDVLKMDLGQDISVGGWGVAHATSHQDKFTWERIHPLESIWDTNCKRNDCSDSQWWGIRPLLDMSTIVARWNPPREEVKRMMTWLGAASQAQGNQARQSQLYVHTVYWRDWSYVDRGYITNDFNEKELVEITAENRGKLTDPPDHAKEKFKGKQTRREGIEIIRFCTFVPREYLTTVGAPKDGVNDWVLAHGEYPLQERNWFDTAQVRSPVKLAAFINSDGEFIGPLAASISPQKLVNQTLATFSGLLNSTGGAGVAISEKNISAKFPEEKLHRSIKNGDTIIVDDKGMGVPNVIGRYDATPGDGLYKMLQIVGYMNAVSKEATSSSDVMRGESTGSEQLVGVTESQEARGLVMELLFKTTVSLLFQQIFQFTAQGGRQFYCKNPAKLEQMVGMDEVIALLMTPEAQLEQFNTEIVMTLSQNARLEQARMQVLQFLQLGLLDPMTAAELFAGKPTPEDVDKATLKAQRRMAEAAKKQQEQQAQAAQTAMLLQRQQQLDEQNSQAYEDAMNVANDRMKEQAKGQQAYQRAEAAAMFPPPESNGQPPNRTGRTQPMSAQPGLR